MTNFYTSRSAIECYKECKRKRWLNYHYGGKGIVQKQGNIPLTTGTCVHEGIGFLLRNVGNGLIDNVDQYYLAEESNWLDSAVSIALQSYQKVVKESGLDTGEQDSKFVLAQELARTEALVRAWSIAELPMIHKYYKVYSVEDEIAVPITNEIIFQARVDAILQGRSDGRMFNYSLKTMKGYRGRLTDRVFAIALQTQTEAWAAEQELKRRVKMHQMFMSEAAKRITLDGKYKNLEQFVAKYMPVPEDRIYGTKHCFLVKGGKAEGTDDGSYKAGDSPFIRGYRMDSGSGVSYCHSYYYPNSNNKSGKGSIGNKWQIFNVWEEMTIKEWIAKLNSKVQDHTGEMIYEMQPECGDIIKQQVITPQETFVKREVVESTLVQITYQESEIKSNISLIRKDETWGGYLDMFFPMTEGACYQMGVCEYLPICHLRDWRNEPVDRKVREDPIGSGLYSWRAPHHKSEEEAYDTKT